MDAVKTSEGAASSYMAYVITSSVRGTPSSSGIPFVLIVTLQRGTVRHRYSEFESLRACLVGLYPVLIVPPIPDKQVSKRASYAGPAADAPASPLATTPRTLAA